MKKIIGILGGCLILIGVILPWLKFNGGETITGLSIENFGLLSIITIILAGLIILISLINWKFSKILLLVLGIIAASWGIYLKLTVKEVAAFYLESKGLDWLSASGLGAFYTIGYGIYVIIFGGIFSFISGLIRKAN